MASGFDILPAIDLRGGRVVRLEQGDFERETAFSNDPVAVAQRFVEAGARWLHVVDLDGARSGVPVHGAVIRRLIAAMGDRVQVEVAGGLRDQRPSVATSSTRGPPASSSGRRPCATRRSPVASSRRTGPSGSRWPSTSAVVAPSARAGPPTRSGSTRPSAVRRLARCGRDDVRGDRHRARRAARRARTSPSTSGSCASSAATIIASAGIATVDASPGGPRRRAARAPSSGEPSTTAASTLAQALSA